MKRITLYFVLIACGIAIGFALPMLSKAKVKPVPVGKITSAPEGDGWLNMLEEPYRAGWGNINDEDEIFEIKDDILHLYGNSHASLRYVGYETEKLGNFELHFEVKLNSGGNSGVFLRQQPNDKIYRGFEIQVQDDFGTPPNKNSTGAIYDVVTPMFNMAFPAGEWNSYDIVVNHDNVVVTVNGWKVVDADLSIMDTPLGKFKVAYNAIPLTGTLAFQDHGGEAWYRNIRLKKLAPSPERETEFVPPEEEAPSEETKQ
jgi:hypothetical protein